MDERILEQLAERFENVLEKPGGKGFKYVPSDDVFDRMNKVFQGNWNTEVLHQSIEDDQALVRVRVTAQDPTSTNSMMFFHEGFASQQIARYSYGNNEGKIIDLGNTYMAAMSKAVKQACKKWGVALGLDDEDATISTPVVNNPTVAPAPASMSASVPSRSDMPPRPEMKQPMVLTAPTVPVAPPAPSVPTPPPIAGEVVEPVSAPLPPTPSPMPAAPSTPQGTNNSGGGKITDVQKIALHGLLTLRGLDYNNLVVEAFAAHGVVKDSIPEPDDLDYDDAVIVIKHGNDLFRKNK